MSIPIKEPSLNSFRQRARAVIKKISVHDLRSEYDKHFGSSRQFVNNPRGLRESYLEGIAALVPEEACSLLEYLKTMYFPRRKDSFSRN